jgi:excisionase family DNA binding protein
MSRWWVARWPDERKVSVITVQTSRVRLDFLKSFHGTHRVGHSRIDTVRMTRTYSASAAGQIPFAAARARERIGAIEMTGPAQTEGLSEVRFLTVAEVAALMRVSKMTVYRLVHGGDLTAVRVGRSFRVPEHAVHEYLRGAFSQTA